MADPGSVKGNLNDPDLTIGKLVWATFKNLIIKIVSSPCEIMVWCIDLD